MTLLILGLVIWVVVHMFPAAMPVQRQAVLSKLGEGPYKGIFSLLIIGSIVLMVFGWKATEPAVIYATGMGFRHVAMLVVTIAYILFVAANVKRSRIKQFIRHPQLTGLIVWAVGHLLANGDIRSLILFSVLGLWAFMTIQLLNKRDGEWHKADSVISWPMELLVIIGGVVLTAIMAWLHIYLSGVALF